MSATGKKFHCKSEKKKVVLGGNGIIIEWGPIFMIQGYTAELLSTLYRLKLVKRPKPEQTLIII